MNLSCLANPHNETVDMVIVALPWVETDFALMAPAALKPIVEKAGLSCLAVDLNVEIVNLVFQHPFKNDLIRFFFDQYSNENTEAWLMDMFESIARQIISYRPRFVGLSVFSYVCQSSLRWVSYYLRKLDPSLTIIIGGTGVLQEALTGAPIIAKELISAGIVDYHIKGDGEHALYELLKGNTNYSGINSSTWQELTREDLAKLPIPDYSNYNFSLYQKQVLGILGSRGCVQDCKFCDYAANWKNFNWRSAEDIFCEMKNQNEKYQINTFKFQDALTNGNLKEFKKFITLLTEYNTNHPENMFKWSGYYIFREITSSSLDDWKLLSQSGANILIVGVENLNQHIRYDMGKKFSNNAIRFHLEQAQKYNITIVMLNLVGWVTETQEDIDFAKKWLIEHAEFNDILHITWGGTLGIHTDTYLDRNKDKLGIVMKGPNPQAWVSNKINSTPKIRAEWATELADFSKKLNFTVYTALDNHFILEKLINVDK
jgi:radical SAM superfamily enzyme YgiQ (UPF0313 family)